MQYEEIYMRAWAACSTAAVACWDAAHSTPTDLETAALARDAVRTARAVPTAFLSQGATEEIIELADAAVLDLRDALAACLQLEDAGRAPAALLDTLCVLRAVIEANTPPPPPVPANVNVPRLQLVIQEAS